MFSDLCWLMYSIIETIDVDFPDPVGHVTSTNHVFLVNILFLMTSDTSLNISSESSFATELIFLITIPTFQSLKNAFTLYGVVSFEIYEKSASLSPTNFSYAF
jgi:hypothetical protein